MVFSSNLIDKHTSLFQSAADSLSDSANATFLQFDSELIDIEENRTKLDCYFIETSTPTDDLIIEKRKQVEEEEENNNFQFQLNDYVSINGKKKGVVKYTGRVHFASGLFCGIELDEAEGRHDGQIDDIR